MQIINFLFPEQCLTSFLNDLLFAQQTELTVKGRFDLHPFFGTRELLPLLLFTGANQDRCEGVLYVVVANIFAVNCTSIHLGFNYQTLTQKTFHPAMFCHFSGV